MAASTKTEQKAEELQIVAGLQKYAATLLTLVIQGKSVTVAAVIATLQARINAILAAQAARIAWIDAVEQQNQQLASTDAFVESLVTVIRGLYAGSPQALADFGQVPRKVTVLTAQQKQEAAAKRAATRLARHTMSAKQKAAIKGTVPVTSTAAPAPATAAPLTGIVGSTATGGGTPHS